MNKTRRDGVTLMEVLVAIFIMGIGMLAMLVLFPLGVLRMQQALSDERCIQACRMATAIANFQPAANSVGNNQQGLRNDPAVISAVTITSGGSGYKANPQATFTGGGGTGAAGYGVLSGSSVVGVVIINPGSGYTSPSAVSFSGGGGAGAAGVANLDLFTNPWPSGSPLLPADPEGRGIPVYVDPSGYVSTPGDPKQPWLAGQPTIPRRTPSYCLSNGLPTSGLAMRWSYLLDELPYAVDGTLQYDFPPNTAAGTPGTFTRDAHFNWAYMLNRPRSADRSVVDMTVVVYTKRPFLSSEFNEYLYQTTPNGTSSEVSFDVPGNSITIDVSDGKNGVPPVRPGDWLLDASYVPSSTGPYATVNGYFYRVTSVTENSPTSYTFEVRQTLRNMAATNSPGAWQKIIFLEGVGDVFEKGSGRIP